MAELDSLSGTGVNGRITKNDVLAYLPNKGKTTTTQAAPKQQPIVVKEGATNGNGASNKPAIPVNAGDEIIEMDRMRKLIADHMVMTNIPLHMLLLLLKQMLRTWFSGEKK